MYDFGYTIINVIPDCSRVELVWVKCTAGLWFEHSMLRYPFTLHLTLLDNNERHAQLEPSQTESLVYCSAQCSEWLLSQLSPAAIIIIILGLQQPEASSPERTR